MEHDCGSLILLDERTMTIKVHGTDESKTRTLRRINDYLDKMASTAEKVVALRGEGRPDGLMKALMVKYGIDLSKLKTETGLSAIHLKHRFHNVILTGTKDSLEKASNLIDKIKEELLVDAPTSKQDSVKELPTCPICFLEVSDEERVRLEYCGHSYCEPCLESQVQASITDKLFPLLCAVEECDEPFVYKDLERLVSKGKLDMSGLVKASIEDFVGRNQTAYRYCITANCNIVYRVTTDGQKFSCPECATNVCTSCHIEYHEGLTCAMYQRAKSGEGSVEAWIKEDPQSRKLCPKCRVGIEKIEGCNHMTCAACKVHICWVCLQFFDTSRECYGHLDTHHGSFV